MPQKMMAGPIPAWNNMANHAKRLNSGLSPSLPSHEHGVVGIRENRRGKEVPTFTLSPPSRTLAPFSLAHLGTFG
jgi:hypothetical protein